MLLQIKCILLGSLCKLLVRLDQVVHQQVPASLNEALQNITGVY